MTTHGCFGENGTGPSYWLSERIAKEWLPRTRCEWRVTCDVEQKPEGRMALRSLPPTTARLTILAISIYRQHIRISKKRFWKPVTALLRSGNLKQEKVLLVSSHLEKSDQVQAWLVLFDFDRSYPVCNSPNEGLDHTKIIQLEAERSSTYGRWPTWSILPAPDSERDSSTLIDPGSRP